MASTTISAQALQGFTDATSYDTHRPSYPVDSVETLIRALNISDIKGAQILEIGAGTGKSTSLLAARKEDFEIVATEPHADMRKVVQGKGLKGVKVMEGNAENLGFVEDGWADAVVCAQVSKGRES